ncbi:MAG TPA: SPFH domain-containing protein [Dehalococcoidia bacterium]|nr:SPFH domain-containing protein [Dehalococcoidia bacterium]
MSLIIVIVVVGAALVGASIKIVKQFERGVVLRFGSLIGTRKPGLNAIIPFVDKMYKVSLRVITTVLEPQEVITKDNVTIKVDAVVYFQVVDPIKAIMNVEFYGQATSQIALTTIRSVLGQSDLDELLAHRDEINKRLRLIIDQQTEDPWGVRVTIVEVKDVQLPETMQRSMAKQAEAEREKRAKIIHAEGEYMASGKLAQAADVITQHPVALQLRYLQTLVEMAGERSSTIIPLPIDIIAPLRKLTDDVLQVKREG